MAVPLQDRKRKYAIQLGKDYAELSRLEQGIASMEALMMMIQMLEIAESDPRISAFSFESEYAYDDEGGYFWTTSITADGIEEDEADYELCEGVRDYATEKSVELLFNDGGTDGEITVEEIRAKLNDN